MEKITMRILMSFR